MNQQIYSRWLIKKILLTVSSLTIANTSYTLLRQKTANDAKAILRKLRLIIDILPLDDKMIGLALNHDTFFDFEDGLPYFTAIENDQDIIITRNLKDFKYSKLPVMTASSRNTQLNMYFFVIVTGKT